MAITVREAIFLGNFADADSDESSMAMENPGIYQSSFGSAGDPLRDHQVAITFDDADENALITSDNFSLADTLTYDLGGGPMTVHIDNLTAVSAASDRLHDRSIHLRTGKGFGEAADL